MEVAERDNINNGKMAVGAWKKGDEEEEEEEMVEEERREGREAEEGKTANCDLQTINPSLRNSGCQSRQWKSKGKRRVTTRNGRHVK